MTTIATTAREEIPVPIITAPTELETSPFVARHLGCSMLSDRKVYKHCDACAHPAENDAPPLTRAETIASGDFFATPDWATDLILPHLPQAGNVLDAGCGTGAILKRVVAYRASLKQTSLVNDRLFGVELHDRHATQAATDGLEVLCMDFMNFHGKADLVIMNPPFSLASEFVEHALEIAPVVSALLLVNFLASGGRAAFHKRHPSHVRILTKRPSFCVSISCKSKCGWKIQIAPDDPRPTSCPKCSLLRKKPVQVTTTDAREYAWFTWGEKGRGGRWSILEV